MFGIKRNSIIRLIIIALILVGYSSLRLIEQKASSKPVFLNQGDIGAWGPVQLHLPKDYVEESLLIVPVITPATSLMENRIGNVLYYWFSEPATPGSSYTLNLEVFEDISRTGEKPVTFEWQFTVRTMAVVYLQYTGTGAELWRTDLDGETVQRLTQTNNGIIDYDVSPDGNEILFSVKNSQNGADLWRVKRDGSGMQQVITCGKDFCSQPDYAPLTEAVVYTRTLSDGSTGSSAGMKQVWMLDLHNGENSYLEVQGSEPDWSPDGSYIAYLGETSGQINILPLDAGEPIELPCQSSDLGSWSADGSTYIYTCLDLETANPFKTIHEFDLSTKSVRPSKIYDILGVKDYSTPVMSPDGQWIVFGERCIQDRPTKQLWLVSADLESAYQLTEDVRFNHAGYQWAPLSKMLVLQRFEMGSSTARPEVLLWQMETGEFSILAADAYDPQWLP